MSLKDEIDLIRITTIPYRLFHMPRYRFGVLKPNQLKEFLKKNGWTKKERDAEDSLAGFPYELEHKYFPVYYNFI